MDNNKKLQTLFKQAELLLKQTNIPVGKITSISINPSLSKTWARCKLNHDGTFSIDVSEKLVENGSDTGIIETILHEMLHTCKGCFNHKGLWKKYAEILNSKFDFNIKRINSVLDKGIEDTPAKIYKYTVRCPSCGKEYYYSRSCRVVKNPERYQCGHCRVSLVLAK